MYFSASHINVKLNQDYSGFSTESLIICDGIGSFENSGKVAKFVSQKMIANRLSSISSLIIDKELLDMKEKVSDGGGGTTILFARKSKSESKVHIEYLGNGGIIHLQGNFAENPEQGAPYRYANLLLPHVNSNGELDKHLSHNSSKIDYNYSEINIKLNQKSGDILLFFTDGITSLEEGFILRDNQDRYWRYEPENIQIVLNELNSFLRTNWNKSNFKDLLKGFLDGVLFKLKNENKLEDDASLGIIISDNVLKFYDTL